MTKLEYTFKTDTLFKMLFIQNPSLLKNLVASLLAIPIESIERPGSFGRIRAGSFFSGSFCLVSANANNHPMRHPSGLFALSIHLYQIANGIFPWRRNRRANISKAVERFMPKSPNIFPPALLLLDYDRLGFHLEKQSSPQEPGVFLLDRTPKMRRISH